MKKNTKNNNGFTLIELIVVFLIIVVLASVVLLNIQGYIKKSKDALSKSSIQSLMISAGAMANNHPSGKYDPGSFDCTLEKSWIDVLKNDSGAVCGTNISVGPNQYSNFCACFLELSNSTPTYYCQDSTGVITEQTVVRCALECNLVGTALCGQN